MSDPITTVCVLRHPEADAHASLIHHLLSMTFARVLSLDDELLAREAESLKDVLFVANYQEAMPAVNIENLARYIRRGATFSSFLISGREAYVGPNFSAISSGGCPECLRIRLAQRAIGKPGASSVGSAAKQAAESDLGPPDLWVPAALFAWFTKQPSPRSGPAQAIAVALNGKSLRKFSVMRCDACSICAGFEPTPSHRIEA